MDDLVDLHTEVIIGTLQGSRLLQQLCVALAGLQKRSLAPYVKLALK